VLSREARIAVPFLGAFRRFIAFQRSRAAGRGQTASGCELPAVRRRLLPCAASRLESDDDPGQCRDDRSGSECEGPTEGGRVWLVARRPSEKEHDKACDINARSDGAPECLGKSRIRLRFWGTQQKC